MIAGMDERLIKLRWPTSCTGCSTELAGGSEAWWNSRRKEASCPSCHADAADTAAPAVAPDAGAAGASARREYEKRSARERAHKEALVAADDAWRRGVKEEHPVIGRLASALTPKPTIGPESQATAAWRQGATGELRVAEILDGLKGISALHDRRIPGSKANIDHLAVGPAGVFVIDAKKYTGGVEKRDVGGWFRVDERLYVGGRDRSKVIDGVRLQMEVVRECLAAAQARIPVHGVVCFVGAEWPLVFRRPVRMRGVTALWPKALGELVGKAGPFDRTAIDETAELLADVLKPA
jgi:hypothetical protein